MFLQPTFIQQPRKSVGTGQMGRAVKITGNAKNRVFDFPQSIPHHSSVRTGQIFSGTGFPSEVLGTCT